MLPSDQHHASSVIAARESRIGVRQPELGLHCLGRSAALPFLAVAGGRLGHSWDPEHPPQPMPPSSPFLFCSYDWAVAVDNHCVCRLRADLCSHIERRAPELP